ncbi:MULTISPECIES: hypothetical protein [Comamonas]|jgi:hypothetical protein|uniref:Uncharacterized protein n=1 Tax=Comamonas avium TaxID=2762231 RepID=A0ABR8S8F1_9BURK|nr:MULTISPECIES: hypothetical protein [Comamonas]MBD7959674.1 hypothetical protein [Comamonas avium]MBD9403139.1 hypothetical protein [Comamonas sp. CMM02]
MTTQATVNLDKLRNAVQQFGAMSFTTSQVATDYHRGENSVSDSDVQHFDGLLHRHAALLGIAPQPSSAGGDTVWQAL